MDGKIGKLGYQDCEIKIQDLIIIRVIFIIVIGMKRRTKKLSLNKHNNNIVVTVKER